MSALRHALHREMAVRVELDADHAFRPDDGARPLDDVAFDVVVAVRHHGAVQAEQQPVDRQRRLELAQDLVAHDLVVGAVGRAGGAGGKAAALDQLEAFRLGARARRRTAARCTCAAHRSDARRAGRTPTRDSSRRLVGKGEKVLVSVASVAVNRRMMTPQGTMPAGRELQCRAMAPGVVSQIVVAVLGDMAKRALEVPQPVRLADDIGVQRDAHDQRPRLGQLQHLVELVDDHVGELLGADPCGRRSPGCRSASCG